MKKYGYVFSLFVFLVSACLFIPLFFYSGFLGPFQTTQILSFYVLIELALPFFFFLLFSQPKLRPNWKNSILLSFLLFLFATTISALFGADPWNSFLGNGHRMDSVVFLWHLFLFFLYLLTLIKSSVRARQTLFRIFLIVAGICGFIGILQVFHLMPFTGEINDSRASSTIGNPIFFAATLIIPFFLAIGAFLKEENTRWKKIYGVIGAATGLGILASGTRGAFVGVMVGCFILGINYAQSKQRRLFSRRSLAIFFLLVAFLFTGFFILRTTSKPGSNLYRTTHLSDSNVSNRLTYWKIALRGWKDAPWLGVGYGNFFVVADKYYFTDLYSSGGVWPDKPHNQFLETLITGGLITFFCFLFFLFILIRSIFTQTRHNNETQRIFLCSALVAYLVQNIFSFDTITPFIAFIVLVAYIASHQNDSEKQTRISLFHYRHLVWISLVLPLSVFFLFILPIVRQFHQTPTSYTTADRKKTFQQLETIRQQPFVFDKSMLTRSYYTLLNQELGTTRTDINFLNLLTQSTIESAKQNLKQHPLRANDWYLYTNILALDAQIKNIPVSSEAFTSAERTISLAPARVEALVALANIYNLNGDETKAIELAQKALLIAPKNADASWMLANFYLKTKTTEEALPFGIRAIKNGVILHNSDDIRWIINEAVKKQDTNLVVYLYERSIQIDPEKLELLPKLAAAYALNRQTQKAIETAQTLLKKDPSSKQAVEAFIKSVQN